MPSLACSDNAALSLAHDPDTGDIYIATHDDYTIYRSASGSVECDINGTNNETLRAAAVDANSPRHLWFTSATRLYECISDNTCSEDCYHHDGVFDAGSDDLSSLAFDDGGTPSDDSDDHLWVGSFSYGLAHYRTSDDSRRGLWNTSNGLPSNRVQAIAIVRGQGTPRVYIGTSGGLVVLDIAFGDITVYDTGTPDALPSNDITALAVDAAADRLWIGTTAGVVRAQPLP